jgi:hypothetical protein
MGDGIETLSKTRSSHRDNSGTDVSYCTNLSGSPKYIRILKVLRWEGSIHGLLYMASSLNILDTPPFNLVFVSMVLQRHAGFLGVPEHDGVTRERINQWH